MSQLRGLPSHANVNSLHQQVIARVQKFEAEAMAANVAPQHVSSARYAICTALDETVLSTPWGSESVWSTHSLLTTFHQEAWGGEKFFQILDRVKTDVMANIDLLEVMYLCLSLGFEGKCKIQERGHVQIASVRDELYRLIRQARGEIERGLAPNWRGVEDKRNPLARYVPLWVVATVLLTVLLGLFISFRVGLSRSTQPIDEVLSGVGVQDIASLNAVAVPNAIRLAPLLAEPESQGLINITEKGGITIVTLQGDNLFASGSATVNEQFTAVLTQIGEAIEQVPGSVNVTGHTDNVPIRSFKFQSNWELSRERAIDVAEKIAESVRAKTRIVPRGVADTLPVAADDTAQGRAMNRRVEIIHTAQAAAQ
jgi:type VI secretion system protein ImpK